LTPSGPVFGETADITKPAERAALVERIDAQHRGSLCSKTFLEHTEADYDRCLEISKAIFFITQRVAKNLAHRKKGGSIVNIGSMWAKQAASDTVLGLLDGSGLFRAVCTTR
jgi:NAD(P)-dependent dehydrogenase (short-subunit alcohol dehydrogenase family)